VLARHHRLGVHALLALTLAAAGRLLIANYGADDGPAHARAAQRGHAAGGDPLHLGP
jgi:hypothetical protein